MDKKTIRQLNEINKEFYLKTQEYFNRTREFYWPGWEKLLPYFQGKTLKVLDVGCGNGRFGRFLEENNVKIKYVGMDNNEYLLNEAKKRLSKPRLINQDIYEDWKLKDRNFDVVMMLGLIHHVPGFENRVRLLKKSKSYLKKGGLLILSIWQFKKIKKFERKIIDWERFKKMAEVNIDMSQLEKNDYILTWEKGIEAYRYCHFVNDEELKKILSELKMELVDEFESDAKEKIGNGYVILKLAV